VTIMLIGALLSLTYSRIRWRVLLPIWLPIIVLTAIHLSFHATARYRLPLDPLLIALASGVLARGQSPKDFISDRLVWRGIGSRRG